MKFFLNQTINGLETLREGSWDIMEHNSASGQKAQGEMKYGEMTQEKKILCRKVLHVL